jgi:hypothetical protein
MWNRGFVSLLATQFFEAASDNIVKGVIAFGVALGGPWETAFGKGGNGVVGVAFTLPFTVSLKTMSEALFVISRLRMSSVPPAVARPGLMSPAASV